ncbi:MAG: hypothetical protein S0880_02270 [Actinomycetota bacterium]|nr:hypothetical protein [Actinomycetota bacterium]
MTTITTAPTAETVTDRAERRLRTVLVANAITSGVAGLAGLVAADFWADTLGIDAVGVVRLVGLGLVLFAIDVAVVSRLGRDRLHRWTPAVSAADAAWVLATVAVLVAGVLEPAGVVLAVVVGLAVADFGLVQMWLRRRMGR